MCFSPQADVAGGLLICAIGVVAVRHIRQRREFIALAWIPVLLGAHQFIEALVWLWLQGHVPRGIGHVALWAYLLIAFVVLPVFVPLAVIALEPTRRRKQMMAPFAVLGFLIAMTLFAAMVRGPVGVKLAPYHLSYSIRLSDGFWIVALYVVAVCGPLLVSGYRNVALFGIVNLVAVIVIARLTISGFASVWCGWAAVSSAASREDQLPRRPGPGVPGGSPADSRHRGSPVDGCGRHRPDHSATHGHAPRAAPATTSLRTRIAISGGGYGAAFLWARCPRQRMVIIPGAPPSQDCGGYSR